MKFVREVFIKAEPEKVFSFHELNDAIDRLTPPWEDVRVIQRADISKIGSRAIFETRLFGLFTTRWVAEHTKFDRPNMFEDTMISGPFAKWRHVHIVKPANGGATLRDEIEYTPPVPFFGALAAPLLVTPKLESMFEYRHNVTREWCETAH